MTTGMRERRAQIVLLVRAFEETDREGRVLSSYTRIAASRRALAVTGLTDFPGELADAPLFRNGEAVMRRARLLFDALERKLPVLRGLLGVAQLGIGVVPVALTAAFIAGLLTNALGPARRVNLLSLPLLGLLGWNLAVYVLSAVAAVLGVRARVSAARHHMQAGYDRLATRLADRILRSALWWRLRRWRVPGDDGETEARVTGKALLRFGALWHRTAAPLLAARIRLMLHAGAAVLVVGVVAGMYLRGFAFEYLATWESTWLSGTQVQALLDAVLAPASAVLGIAVPNVAAVRGPDGAGEAAPWIHLYAMTALLFVVVPRAALALAAAWRAAWLARRLPVDLDDPYFTRIFTAWRGASRRVRVAPYSYRPHPAAADALKTLLHDFFGARAEIRIVPPVPYGAAAAAVLNGVEGSGGRDRDLSCVVLFNLAQSPEAEVHGVFLEELKERVEARHAKLLVMIDVSVYRERVPSPERWHERLHAWQRVVREAGLSAVDLALDTPAGEDVLHAVGARWWPAPDPVGAR